MGNAGRRRRLVHRRIEERPRGARAEQIATITINADANQLHSLNYFTGATVAGFSPGQWLRAGMHIETNSPNQSLSTSLSMVCKAQVADTLITGAEGLHYESSSTQFLPLPPVYSGWLLTPPFQLPASPTINSLLISNTLHWLGAGTDSPVIKWRDAFICVVANPREAWGYWPMRRIRMIIVAIFFSRLSRRAR